MFDFVRKPFLWRAWDSGFDKEIGSTGNFHLKSIQDLAVYEYLRGSSGKFVAEVGGGNSRILANLARRNRCFNVEKFDGSNGGPSKEIAISGVKNVLAFLGEFNPQLSTNSFDFVFSVSVVEHVPNHLLARFLDDGLRILKTGGVWLHAIDLYIEDEPDDYQNSRFNAYRRWIEDPRLKPIGQVYTGPLKFTCDMATNPDDTMYSWGKIAPSLIPLRQRAQSVSLLIAAAKN